MLEAHIAFEVEAWTSSLTDTLSSQVSMVFEWLDGVSLGSVFGEADLDVLLDTLLARARGRSELVDGPQPPSENGCFS